MRNISETVLQRYTSVSRRIFCLGWGLSFILSGLIALALQSPWSWLTGWQWVVEGIGRLLLAFSFLSLVVGLITAGLLFIALYPELGHAWLRGINPIWYRKDWREMSDFAKLYAFFHAVVFFIAGVLFAHQIIINTWFK